MLSLFPEQDGEKLDLKRLDGYRRGFIDFGFWECENGGTVIVEDDATPGFSEVRASLQSGICSRCCHVNPPESVKDMPEVIRGAPCWKVSL